jgi:hypothetical protein
LYADVVLADGQVVVVYLAWLDCAGIHSAAATIERYAPDGTRAVLHALDPPPPLDPDALPGRLSIGLATATGAFQIEYSNGSASWAPAGAPEGLCWRVLRARAEAVVTWTGTQDTRLWQGEGYIDWVDLSRPPRLLRLRALAWGRAHWSDEAAAYTTVVLASGRRWTRAARWRSGALAETLEDVKLEHAAAGGLLAAAGNNTWLRLGSGRVLHQGAGLDRERFPRLSERIGARLLTGTIDETRWLCPVITPAPDGRTSCAIHEVVHFGSRSSARGRSRWRRAIGA